MSTIAFEREQGILDSKDTKLEPKGKPSQEAGSDEAALELRPRDQLEEAFLWSRHHSWRYGLALFSGFFALLLVPFAPRDARVWALGLGAMGFLLSFLRELRANQRELAEGQALESAIGFVAPEPKVPLPTLSISSRGRRGLGGILLGLSLCGLAFAPGPLLWFLAGLLVVPGTFLLGAARGALSELPESTSKKVVE